MFGLKYKMHKRVITKYFMSQDGMQKYIAGLKMLASVTEITILPNALNNELKRVS